MTMKLGVCLCQDEDGDSRTMVKNNDVDSGTMVAQNNNDTGKAP